MTRIPLPPVIANFVEAHEKLIQQWATTGLKFTLDGRLVGDIAEAVAAHEFGLHFPERRTPGVDLLTKDGLSVQIKASGIGKGPAFSPGEGIADHLIFMMLDFKNCHADVLYNGPEAPVRAELPSIIRSSKRVPLKRVVEINAIQTKRLPLVKSGKK